MTAVEVHLDCGPRAARGAPAPPTRVGTLFTHLRRGRLTSTFAYAEDWLADPRAYPLDPELPLVTGLIAPTAALPRAVADAAPDRWGRDLIARQARADGQTRTLDESDYLLGVGDLTRHGALRFRLEPGGPFVAAEPRVPPLVELPRLAAAARQAVDGSASAVKALLDAGGASLGGARPKAAVRDGPALLLAKFPHPGDAWNVMAWEKTALDLAQAAGVNVPASRLVRLGAADVLVQERFDRVGERRIGYLSAMTALSADDGESRDYLELADAVASLAARPDAALEELWRRLMATIALGNTDDHLRNHGLSRRPGQGGWELAPAFDVNPNPDPEAPRVTVIAGQCARAESWAAAMDGADQFGLGRERARQIAAQVLDALGRWRQAAAANGLSRAELDRFAPVLDWRPPTG